MSTPAGKNRRPLTITRNGVVVGDKRSKTRTVQVTFLARDRKYGKYLKCKSRYQVQDPLNSSSLGDLVQIASCRPISKTKNWRLLQIVEKAAGPAHQAVGA